jgi:hypothetical protein
VAEGGVERWWPVQQSAGRVVGVGGDEAVGVVVVEQVLVTGDGRYSYAEVVGEVA